MATDPSPCPGVAEAAAAIAAGSLSPVELLRSCRARIDAVKAFRELPEAQSLASANKRIQNILKKSGSGGGVSVELLGQDEERRLHASLESLAPRVEQSLERQDFAAALKDLAGIRDDVDAFFDKVLVNAEDEKVRANRLALLTKLGLLMNRVADISKLAS